MGMDGVEIVMDVEDHFGISIQDSEAEHVRTVGDLVSLVHARITAAQREHCPTLRAFFSLRKVTRGVFGDDSLRIRPRDAVTNVLSPRQRAELWARLPDLLGTPPDSLRRPRRLRRVLAGTSIGLLLLALISAFAIDYEMLPLIIFFAGCVIVFLYFATASIRSVPPDGWMTFGEIATRIAGVRVATKMVHLRTHDEILNELRPLLVNVLRVDETAIVPSARLIEDLGMD